MTVTAGQAPPLTVVRPGEGPDRDLGAIGVAFKLLGAHTAGQVAIVEHPFPVGSLVPPHLRHALHSASSSPPARR
jgi:hypothetical protein